MEVQEKEYIHDPDYQNIVFFCQPNGDRTKKCIIHDYFIPYCSSTVLENCNRLEHLLVLNSSVIYNKWNGKRNEWIGK